MEARSLRSARRRRGEFHDVDVQNQPFPKPLKDFCIETDLSGQVWVVPPDEEGGKALADRVVGALGKGAATRIASEVTEADCADAEIVVLGNVHNNDLMRRLGMDFYLWTDHYFPGGDGYEVRTVHNPFGSGRNVVQLGGSTIEGAGRAADAFLGILDTNGTRLSRINQVVSDRIPKQPPSDDQVRENIDRINESIAISGGQGPLRQMVQNGLMYYLTGHDGYGQMFREEFLFFIDLVEEVGTWALAKGTNVYFWGYRMFTAWDVLEEGDVLSDADRLKMTTGLYNILRWVSAMTHFRYDAPDEIVQHQNHQSFAASTLYTGARYFKKYYGLKTYDQKLPYAQRILELHARSYKPNDNAGTGYIWLTPSHVIKYGMLSGDFSFLENGHLARLLDSAVLTIDSLGDECTYGDVGGYSGGRSRRPAGLNAAAIGAWFYNDGRYRWLHDWMAKGVNWEDPGGSPMELYDGYFFKDIPPVEPTDLLGARASILDAMAYEIAEEQTQAPWRLRDTPTEMPVVPPEEAFDKLAMRRSFDRRSEYLLIDGPTSFAHSQEDGNAIIRICWNERIWLADLDYIRRLARYHNTVVIAKDGECLQKPLQAALKAIADFEDWGYSRTVSPGDNGTDWARNIFWRKGRYFLVLDTVEAKETGSYLLDCIWRVLGSVQEDGSTLHLEQTGERFHIAHADEADRWLTDREADYAPDRANWDSYPHADGVVRMWHQTKRVELGAGDQAAYINLLYPSNDEQDQALDVERIDTSVAMVRDRATGQGEILGVAEGGYQSGDLEVDGALFRIDRNGFSIVKGTTLSWQGPLFRSWTPVCAELDFSAGSGTIEAEADTRVGIRADAVTVNGQQTPGGGGEGRLVWFSLPAGRHRIEITPAGDGFFDALVRSTSAAPDGYAHAVRESVPKEGLEAVWSYDAGSRISAVSDDADGHILVGTGNGGVRLLERDGAERWSFDAGSEVRDVHLADIDGQGIPTAIVGTEECKLYVLDEEGSKRWDHTFAPGSNMREQKVMSVSSADLEGEGSVQVLVGTEGWFFHAFEADGTHRWEAEIRFHSVTGCLAADVDGDGNMEILVGTEYYAINCLNSDGSFRWLQNTGCVGRTILAGDVDGKGCLEVIYGDWRGVNSVRGETGDLVWRVNMGGETEDVAIADLNGDGHMEVVAGSDVGQLVCIRDGEVVWRRDLIDKITWLTASDWDGDGCAEVVVGLATGQIWVYDGDGRLIAGHDAGSEVTYLRGIELDDGDRILCGTAAGKVAVYRPTW